MLLCKSCYEIWAEIIIPAISIIGSIVVSLFIFYQQRKCDLNKEIENEIYYPLYLIVLNYNKLSPFNINELRNITNKFRFYSANKKIIMLTRQLQSNYIYDIYSKYNIINAIKNKFYKTLEQTDYNFRIYPLTDEEGNIIEYCYPFQDEIDSLLELNWGNIDLYNNESVKKINNLLNSIIKKYRNIGEINFISDETLIKFFENTNEFKKQLKKMSLFNDSINELKILLIKKLKIKGNKNAN